MKSNKYLGHKAFALFAFFALASSHSAFAGSISNCTGGSGDYSDAPSSYGVACHDTNRWQQLGSSDASLFGDSISTNDNNNVGWTSESAPMQLIRVITVCLGQPRRMVLLGLTSIKVTTLCRVNM